MIEYQTRNWRSLGIENIIDQRSEYIKTRTIHYELTENSEKLL